MRMVMIGVLIGTLFFPLSTAFSDLIVFEVESEGTVSRLQIAIERDGGQTLYRSEFDTVSQFYRYSGEGILVEWQYRDPSRDTDFTALRKEEIIDIFGTRNGDVVQRQIDVNTDVWLQNSEFGLMDFVLSERKRIEFIVIKPEDLSVSRLRVRKMTKGQIDFMGRKVDTLRLRAQPPGVASLLWHADYWYELPDYRFILYRAEGAPGLPKTEIRLVDEIR